MMCLVLAFLAVTFAYQALTRVLWLYEARVHGGINLRGPRLPYFTAFFADWCAFVFGLLASVAALVPRSRARAVATASRPVMVVHGSALTRGASTLLIARLRRDGREARACGYGRAHSAHAKAGRLATALRDLAAQTGAHRVDVITHGEGGVIVRSAARDHGCLDVLGNVVSLGAPHRGAALASFFAWRSLAHLCPGSRYLTALAESDPVPEAINFTSISSSFDATVFPPELAYYTGAMNISLDWVGHHALLTSERIYRLAKENIDIEPKTARRD
jgi:hypothetical protein